MMIHSTNPHNIETEGIKYAGSKLRLLPRIMQIVSQIPDIHSVLDGFSGTTRLSQAFAQMGYNTTSNDISVWSYVFAQCYLTETREDAFYQEILDYLNHLKGYDGWFTEHYGGLAEDIKKPFQRKNTQKLDAIRDAVEGFSLSSGERAVILTSLMLGLDRVDSTLGHFSSYLSKWSARSYRDLILRLPKRFELHSENKAMMGDIFDTIENETYDLVYLDPPYGSNNEKMPPSRVRYSAYYHFWETVVLHDRPEVFGKAHRRVDSRDHVRPCIFESYHKDSTGKYEALQALDRLLNKIQARYILLSYSSGGRATWEELKEILEKSGKLMKFYEIDYRKNVMASMSWTGKWRAKDSDNKEFLFLLQKGT